MAIMDMERCADLRPGAGATRRVTNFSSRGILCPSVLRPPLRRRDDAFDVDSSTMLEPPVVLVHPNGPLSLTLLPFCLRVHARAVRIRSLSAG